MAVDSTSPVGGKTNENEITVANRPIVPEKGYFSVYARKPGTDKWSPVTKYPTPEEAEEIARSLWGNGKAPTELGNEWEEIDRIGVVTKIENDD